MKQLVLGLLLLAPLGCHAGDLSFNGIRLGDLAARVLAVRKEGLCELVRGELSECTIFDSAGIAYYVNGGRVVRMEARRGVARTASLPFGLALDGGLAPTLRRSISKSGDRVSLVPSSFGFTLIQMIREPSADYEFELQLRFDEKGRLESVIYKDVL